MKHKQKIGIIGNGPWGKRIQKICKEEFDTSITLPLSRKQETESLDDYLKRLHNTLSEPIKKVDIVFLAISPSNQYDIANYLIEQNKHLIIEKPWLVSTEKTRELINKAKQNQVSIGVHFPLSLHPDMPKLSKEFNQPDCTFSFTFLHSKENRLNLSAIHNVGIHYLALKQHFFPNTKMGSILCKYADEEKREIYLAKEGSARKTIDFMNASHPLIQNFISLYIDHTFNKKTPFPFGLEFSQKLNDTIEKYNL